MSKRKKEVYYRMEMTEAQALIIMDALELKARISMGQLDEIQWQIWPAFRQKEGDKDPGKEIDSEAVRELFGLLRKHFTGYQYGEYGGIAAQPERIKIGMEIRDVIRHRTSWDRYDPKTMGRPWTVNYDSPFRMTSHPLVKIERVVEKTTYLKKSDVDQRCGHGVLMTDCCSDCGNE